MKNREATILYRETVNAARRGVYSAENIQTLHEHYDAKREAIFEDDGISSKKRALWEAVGVGATIVLSGIVAAVDPALSGALGYLFLVQGPSLLGLPMADMLSSAVISGVNERRLRGRLEVLDELQYRMEPVNVVDAASTALVVRS